MSKHEETPDESFSERLRQELRERREALLERHPRLVQALEADTRKETTE